MILSTKAKPLSYRPQRKQRERSVGHVRRGMSAVEVVVALAVTFSLAMVLFFMARVSCGNLYHVISTFVGWPY